MKGSHYFTGNTQPLEARPAAVRFAFVRDELSRARERVNAEPPRAGKQERLKKLDTMLDDLAVLRANWKH